MNNLRFFFKKEREHSRLDPVLHTSQHFPLHFLKIIFSPMTPEAEKFNGWAAMLGFVAAFGAYATTGQIIPGIF